MPPNPIRKVLSTLRSFQVRHLLMGGQACVLYGGAEFSRWRPRIRELEAMRHEKLNLDAG